MRRVSACGPRIVLTRSRSASAKPTVIRLERTSGEIRSFWEITRVKTTLTTHFGRRLSAGRTLEKVFESPAAAEKAMAKAIEEKRREGYAEPVARGEVGSASRKGVIARNPELETLIDEAPHDAERYLVYADWLQQQGDVRGELIVVQHGIATADDAASFALERDEAKLFKKFESELLGPLARFTTLRNSIRSYRTFSWRHGFIRTARLSWVNYLNADVSEVLEMLLKHPSGRFLEHLILGQLRERDAERAGEANIESVHRLLREHAPPTLTSVTIESSTLAGAWLWMALPRLRHLTAQRIGTEPIRADSLERLHLGSAMPEELRLLAPASLPSLKRLHLTLPLRESEAVMSTVLAAAPRLQHLSVRRWVTVQVPYGMVKVDPQDALARGVVRAAAARDLPRLDLEMAMSAAAAKALVAEASTVKRIGSLVVPLEGVPAEQRGRLESACGNIAWSAVPEEEELELDAIDRSATNTT